MRQVLDGLVRQRRQNAADGFRSAVQLGHDDFAEQKHVPALAHAGR